MLAPTTRKKSASRKLGESTDSISDLKIISDLGRSLLFMVHPKKVASRVAEAIQDGVNAERCAFVAELANIGRINCVFGPEGEIGGRVLHRSRFERWLQFMPPHVGYAEENVEEFFLTGAGHTLEYISPLHINGDIKGAIVVSFADKHEFSMRKARLIDAATQMAAMSVNLSAHYETAQ